MDCGGGNGGSGDALVGGLDIICCCCGDGGGIGRCDCCGDFCCFSELLLLKFSGTLMLLQLLLIVLSRDDGTFDVDAGSVVGAIVIVVCGGSEAMLAAATGVSVTFSIVVSLRREGDGLSSEIM